MFPREAHSNRSWCLSASSCVYQLDVYQVQEKIFDSRQGTIAAVVRGLPGTTAASRRALFFFF